MTTVFKIAAIILFFSLSAPAQDFLCTSSGARFQVPGACKQQCRPTRAGNALTRGATGADKPCSFQPNCAAILKRLTGPGDGLRMAYNAALFGKTPMPRPREVIISLVLYKFFPPYRYQNFNVQIGNVQGLDQWASIEPARTGARPTLTVNPDLYLLTPAYFISVIGHELIHEQQYKRKNPFDPTGINAAIASLRELEATNWQMAIDDFNHGFRSDTYYCVEDSERRETQQTHACREWQVKKAVSDIRTGPRATTLLPQLEKWMQNDPWTKQVFIPFHPDWKTAKAGRPPDDVCPSP